MYATSVQKSGVFVNKPAAAGRRADKRVCGSNPPLGCGQRRTVGARQFPRYLNVHLFLKKHAFVRFYPFGSRRRYKRLHRRAIMSRKVKTSDFFGTVPIPKPRPRGLKLESSLTIATRAFVPIPKPRFRGLKLQVLFESCGYALQSQYPNPALGD